MSTTWFYAPEIALDGLLPEEEAHHAARVLRHKPGDMLEVTDGKGALFQCRISGITGKKVQVEIIDMVEVPTPHFQDFHLAIAPTKNNDRMEWMLEKVAEVGIRSITPVICHHSERKVINPERWQKVLISAMKQSGKTTLPILHPVTAVQQLLKQPMAGIKAIAHLSDTGKSFRDCLQPGITTTVLVGPEGDFSDHELSLAHEMNWTPVTLGPYRLRTETAGMVACVQFNFINQNQPVA